MKTIRLLESVSGLDYNYRYGQIVSVEDTRADQLIAKAIAELYTGDGEYLEYVALLTQSGTSAPVATILNSAAPNYLGGITWSYFGQGMYLGAKTGAFTANKTGYIYPGYLANGFMSMSEWSPLNEILIETKNLSGGNLSSYNGALNKTLTIIRVYS